jgi:iron complex outermembrane receptor protein
MLALLTQGVAAQKKTVTINVTDASTGNPLSGVSVRVRSASIGSVTGANGNTTVQAMDNDQLEVSYVGYTMQLVSVNGQSVINVKLQPSTADLGEVIMVGTRSLPRSVTSSPLPIDNFDAATLRSTGQTTFDKQLQYRVPSFNTVNTPVNDATTLLDPYEIRNLGPSRTLILVNGKRKNLSSLLYVQFSPGRGETGPDISAIPVDAIKNVEILRDGASAQYGSDAIAGVMNITLKDRYQYSSLTFNGGTTHKLDGTNYGLSFNSGSNIGSKGYLNYTIALSQQDNALRSGTIDLPTEIATFGGDQVTDDAITRYLAVYPDGNNDNGTGAITASKFLYNLGIPISDELEMYSNAAVVLKKVNSNANFRTPYWRIDMGLLHEPVPGAPDYTGSGYGGVGVQELFVVDKANGVYQGYLGYEPTFEGDLSDYTGTFGFKRKTNGWTQDISITVGGNQQLYTVDNTINRTLLKSSPTSFKPGGYGFNHVVGNFDMSKSLTEDFAIGFGTEIRKETYKIIAGDTASYSGEGANSFPGIRAENAGTFSRYNYGAYFDASYNATENWLINGTVRGERYSDFGPAFVYRLSSRIKTNDDKFTLRGSASTGFRAPTLHQIYNQSTQASFVAGTIQLSGLFNNNSKQAFLLDVPQLKPEKSTNYTIGFGWTPKRNVSITLDYYSISIRDRIVYSSAISSSDPSTTLYQILQDAGVVQAQFFINGIKTNTQGIDLVANWRGLALGSGKFGINLAGNYTLNNEIVGDVSNPKPVADAGADILSAQIRSLLTESRPVYKGILGFDYSINDWNFMLNNTLFGPTKFQDLDNGGAIMNNIKQVFTPNVVTDLNIGYNFSSKVSATLAVNNLLNVLPKWDLELTGDPSDPNYADAAATLADPEATSLLKGFLGFSGRYSILGYNGSQFSQLGTLFQASLTFKF